MIIKERILLLIIFLFIILLNLIIWLILYHQNEIDNISKKYIHIFILLILLEIFFINEITKKYTLICISSKSPNKYLFECIKMLYKIQVKDDSTYKICIVDSDSNDFSYYDEIKQFFPNVEIYFIKNKNYEYGAWKYIFDKYPYYHNYFCIQDSIIINNYINLDDIDDNNVYTYHEYSGYTSHLDIKQKGIENLRESNLKNYDLEIDKKFTLAQHNIFIVNNKIMKDIFMTLTKPPVDKHGSCFYERNFGLYFILKKINAIPLNNHLNKIHGERI